MHCLSFLLFFFNDTATTEIYTLSLHDALPICLHVAVPVGDDHAEPLIILDFLRPENAVGVARPRERQVDRKSTRLNSSHSQISYAVFCLKKKKIKRTTRSRRRHTPSHCTTPPR